MNQDSKKVSPFSAEGISNGLSLVGGLLKTKKFWVELVIMTLGMFVAALGVYFFLIPSKLIVGSITGLSIVISKLLPIISVGNVIFIINAFLLVLSFLLIGNEFGAKTVYTALILGPMVDLIGKFVPMTESMFTQHLANGGLVTNPWFDLLCFVLVLSASQSILFSINASTGGLDILAKIINKYTGINLGTSVTVAGGAICCTAFAINPPYLVIIGLIGTWMNGLILNHFMMGMNMRNRVFIISKEYERIQDYAINTLHRGVTMHEVIGGFSHQKSIQLEIILNNEELSSLMAFLAKEDIDSFCTTDTVSEVRGLWNKSKKSKH
ncbi:YitT family protein [Prevotella aurantiaca]|jgi:putative membrane protein|uniref:YitT family protein n=1 Tax=Prevotella aurantiaca TaxID=596085 RepID=A0A930N053_9BACT|nr:YitT family protein [Prevotella aurantiaca]MBF1384895.1 YitT family protein [Prevotella aurantiaca]MBF1386714.1 YitT family protein [Prevotella aurantiaca]